MTTSVSRSQQKRHLKAFLDPNSCFRKFRQTTLSGGKSDFEIGHVSLENCMTFCINVSKSHISAVTISDISGYFSEQPSIVKHFLSITRIWTANFFKTPNPVVRPVWLLVTALIFSIAYQFASRFREVPQVLPRKCWNFEKFQSICLAITICPYESLVFVKTDSSQLKSLNSRKVRINGASLTYCQEMCKNHTDNQGTRLKCSCRMQIFW